MINTSEYVGQGHPDKVADYISDSILDAVLAKDKNAKVACETMVTTNFVLIAGEITANCRVDYEKIALKAIKEIGYTNLTKGFNPDKIKVIVKVHEQSPDIALGVCKEKQGAGDQGIMFGYATDETDEYLPQTFVYAHHILLRLNELRKTKKLPYLLPDAKCQVTIKDNHVESVVLSSHHKEDVKISKLREELKKEVILKVIPQKLINEKTSFFINYTGRFVVGGPDGDCGLTGRKIIVDTYGGHAKHGGGAFSGKDPSKVDRSAAYMARYIAKNIVAKGYAKKCDVSLSYAIGYEKQTSFRINTFNTNTKYSEKELEEMVLKRISLSPKAIEEYLGLRSPIYKQTVLCGHFFGDFPWEKINLFK